MTPTPELDPDALAAARTWAAEHGHPQPDDRMLAAYGRVIAARAAEQERQHLVSLLDRRLASKHLTDDAKGWIKYARAVIQADANTRWGIARRSATTGGEPR